MRKRVPFSALSDRQWDALRPYVLAQKASNAGRKMVDLRERMNAILFLLSTDAPWRELPERYGPPGTVSRHFRRLSHGGFWEHLLEALHDLGPRHPLQQLRRVIFRGARRAAKLVGLRIIVLARRLQLLEALPGPPWLLPDPDLSKTLVELFKRKFEDPEPRRFRRWWRKMGRTYIRLFSAATGRRHIPRSVRLAMP
ncbi:transposase [Roseococcus sp. SDR]|uniref:transposase n=1 Tax=Roseococcus sp. SDR TaxID=2835532 RepID=UPI001BCDA7E9|nr:transposase [Roseococcus sp. SDR]MBS7790928.1 transposase [Roseococcus sp. SDR]MBV1846242.1 transposase [Roseococcus sp. SDR]